MTKKKENLDSESVILEESEVLGVDSYMDSPEPDFPTTVIELKKNFKEYRVYRVTDTYLFLVDLLGNGRIIDSKEEYKAYKKGDTLFL